MDRETQNVEFFAQTAAVTYSLAFLSLSGLLIVLVREVISRLSKEYSLKHRHSEDPRIGEVMRWVLKSIVSREGIKSPKGETLSTDLWMLSVILSYWILTTFCLVGLFGRFSCLLISQVGNTLFMISKTVLYWFLIDRAQKIYSGSVFEYSRRFVRSINICIGVTNLGCAIGLLVTINARRRILYAPRAIRCVYDYEAWIVLPIVVSDLTFSLLALALLTRPLRELLNTDTSDPSNPVQLQLALTAKKITILTYVAMISTFVVLLSVSLTRSIFATPVDFVINCCCLMLMSNYFHSLYPSLCCGAVFCADYCCGCDSTGKLMVEPAISKHIKSVSSDGAVTAPQP